MKIIFYNMAYGTGMDGSWSQYIRKTWRFFWLPFNTLKDIAKALNEHDADVLCLAEVDSGSFRNRFRCQAKALSINLLFPFYKTESKYHPRSIWKWMNLIRKQHDAVLSKQEGQVVRHHLKSGMKKLVQEYIVNGYSIFTVHLAVLSESVRKKQLQELAEIIAKCPRPHILCGDFNIFSGLVEVKDFVEQSKMKLVPNMPSFPSFKPKTHLDLFLTSPEIKIKNFGVVPVKYSDHLPVWIELA